MPATSPCNSDTTHSGITVPNPELELARAFVEETGVNLFVTGKAGTGKTTFLQNMRRRSAKRMVVTAPTGVAAINCGGVTLHSFFQLPFGPFLPGSDTGRLYRLSRQKINIIKSLDLLVIDEVSMVRADMLDGVDSVLRRYRRSSLPFGGIQLLLIGDLYQLPPVVTGSDMTLLSGHYDSYYFFHSRALQKTELVTIELQHIYRQKDQHFVNLLNQIRENCLDRAGLCAINSRLQPELTEKDHKETITLCTHNQRADEINRSRLAAIPTKSRFFRAAVEGDFPEQGYPTESSLELKVGAQVMFVRNDHSPEKRYFNGKIGVISKMAGAAIYVRCADGNDEIEVEPATWENMKYELDEESREIKEQVVGTFAQYPLKLAWAITIHKSQGLTFERAVIDAQAAFAYGQVYVALSRLTSLDGMILSTPLDANSIKTDPVVMHFAGQCRNQRPEMDFLYEAKVRYQQQLLLDCFDFQRLRWLVGRLITIPKASPGLVRLQGIDDPTVFARDIERQISSVGDNFRRQLSGLYREDLPPAEDRQIRERLAKASAYFLDRIATIISSPLALLDIDTDNAEIAKKARKTKQLLLEEVAAKTAGIEACGKDFSPAAYLRAISVATVQLETSRPKTAKTVTTYQESDVGHPELYQQLKTWRQEQAKKENVTPFQVIHLKTLIQIAVNLPDSPTHLRKIKGIGPRLSERYGAELVAMVAEYRRSHNIEEVVLPVPKISGQGPAAEGRARAGTSSVKKGESVKITLEMRQEGCTVEEIMTRRGLARSTVEGHLIHLLETGRLAIETVLDSDKQRLIEETLEALPGKGLGALKEKLGESASYNEIKMVQAHRKHLETP